MGSGPPRQVTHPLVVPYRYYTTPFRRCDRCSSDTDFVCMRRISHPRTKSCNQCVVDEKPCVWSQGNGQPQPPRKRVKQKTPSGSSTKTEGFLENVDYMTIETINTLSARVERNAADMALLRSEMVAGQKQILKLLVEVDRRLG